jgi:hypothetical protein
VTFCDWSSEEWALSTNSSANISWFGLAFVACFVLKTPFHYNLQNADNEFHLKM